MQLGLRRPLRAQCCSCGYIANQGSFITLNSIITTLNRIFSTLNRIMTALRRRGSANRANSQQGIDPFL